MSWDRLVELSIPSISTVDRLKRNEFNWIRGQIWGMFLLSFLVIIAVFKFVRSTFQNGGDSPWSGECILELIDVASLCIRLNGAMRKNDVANWIDMRVRRTSNDKFLMVRSLLLHYEFSDFMTCRQMRRKFLQVRHNCARWWCQLPVFPTRVINRKCKLLANGN